VFHDSHGPYVFSQHLGLLKAKLAKLKREIIEGPKSSSGPKGEGFDVTKAGDARVGLVGQ